ncbi:hypothetical protein [Metamycoplasma hominis]|uniref:hypothetical protein n=1 Tax=Metamycoplasma hominis TaxID=2098 RepID=UPI003CEFA873
MNEEINKLKINIDEFKQNFWYAKAFEIPYHVKRINPKISENEFFEILSKDVYLLCDLFIDQKMSEILKLELTREQIIEIIGLTRFQNFKNAIYTEIKYRLASGQIPEFEQKQKITTNLFSVLTPGREFSHFKTLLSGEAIALLTNPGWEKIKLNDDDFPKILDYLQKFVNTSQNTLKSVDKKTNDLSEIFSVFQIATSKTLSEYKNFAKNWVNSFDFKLLGNNAVTINSSAENPSLKIGNSSNKSIEFRDEELIIKSGNFSPHIIRYSDIVTDKYFSKKFSELETEQLNSSNLINKISNRVDDNKKLIDYNSSRTSSLSLEIEAAKNKAQQLEAALTVNSTADAETLRKFNELNSAYLAKVSQIQNTITDDQQKLDDLSSNHSAFVEEFETVRDTYGDQLNDIRKFVNYSNGKLQGSNGELKLNGRSPWLKFEDNGNALEIGQENIKYTNGGKTSKLEFSELMKYGDIISKNENSTDSLLKDNAALKLIIKNLVNNWFVNTTETHFNNDYSLPFKTEFYSIINRFGKNKIELTVNGGLSYDAEADKDNPAVKMTYENATNGLNYYAEISPQGIHFVKTASKKVLDKDFRADDFEEIKFLEFSELLDAVKYAKENKNLTFINNVKSDIANLQEKQKSNGQQASWNKEDINNLKLKIFELQNSLNSMDAKISELKSQINELKNNSSSGGSGGGDDEDSGGGGYKPNPERPPRPDYPDHPRWGKPPGGTLH